jgi:hypothetical protein
MLRTLTTGQLSKVTYCKVPTIRILHRGVICTFEHVRIPTT